MSPCSVADCDRPSWRRGWCTTHYRRQLRNHGNPFPNNPIGRGGYPLTDCGCRQCVVNPWFHRAPRCPLGHGPKLVLLYYERDGVEWWNCIEPSCSGKRFRQEAMA